MNTRVLVAYASKAGSTGEVAESIAKVISERGAAVDVRPVQKVKGIDGYQAVVVGSAVRMGRVLPEAQRFVNKHKARLAGLPTAYFTVSLTLKEDTPENRAKANAMLDPMRQAREPIQVGLFAGKFDLQTVEPLFRFMLGRVKSADMAPGDYRNWTAIRAWAGELASAVLPGPGPEQSKEP